MRPNRCADTNETEPKRTVWMLRVCVCVVRTTIFNLYSAIFFPLDFHIELCVIDGRYFSSLLRRVVFELTTARFMILL